VRCLQSLTDNPIVPTFELLPSSSRRNLSSRRANKALAKHVSVSGVVLQYADVETVGDYVPVFFGLV